MTDLTIWTYDWVPEGPRGFVRDVRLRWASEEAGLSYRVKTVAFEDRGPSHFARQPFGQVPFLTDGEVTLFESGACLLHLARRSEKLMPRDGKGEAETLEWTIAALNSIEMVSVPWWFVDLGKPDRNPLEDWLGQRLDHLDQVLSAREWLAGGRFTVADLLMADVLRVPGFRAFNSHKSIEDYIARITARPAFRRAYDAQLAHFREGDIARSAASL